VIIRSNRVVLPGGVMPAEIHVREGKIQYVGRAAAKVAAFDAGDLVVLPGIVDTHVHVNEPGRTEWEGFETATCAAAAGGVTTLVDMPLNSIPATTTVGALDAKRAAAASQSHVDVAYWGGVVPGNQDELEPLVRAGVRGFKCFLAPSGVPEFEHVTEHDLHLALPIIAELDVPLLVHAELPAALRDPHGDPRRYRTWLDSRPPESERAAIELLIQLAREYDARVHIVHVADADALTLIAGARAAGVKITAETCPHYLTFAAEDIDDGATTFKCAPPIRESRHCDALWKGLADGVLDLVATDHSPAPPAMKHRPFGDFLGAWGGIASLQLGLSATWTGAQARGLGIDRVAEWMSAAPARLAGLERKGQIAAGCDADLVIWDPDAVQVVDAAHLFHRHPITPYQGLPLRGQVRTTILRGEVVFDAGTIVGPARGRTM
jgi:allantoinase